VICVNVHPSRPLAVSGEIGKPGRVLVWDYNFMRLSRDSFSENNTITELFLGDECRSVRSVSFSGDGRFILALGLDDANTVIIFDWQSSSIVATAKLGHPEVSQISFNNFLFNSIDRISDHQTLSPRSSVKSSDLAALDNSAEEVGCYTIISCGGKHIKFWTLTRTVIRRDDPNASPDSKSFKGRQLAIPKHKQNIVMKYDLVGNVGVTPRSSAADNIEFTCFACTNNMAERGSRKKSRVLAGSAAGSIYIWSQLEDEVLSKATNFNAWLARGRLLSVVTDVHDKPIVDMSYYFRWEESTNKPIDKLATCGADSMVNVWNIGDSSAELTTLPIRFSSALNLDDTSLMYGYARAICWNDNGRDVVVGTAQNNIVYIPNMDITNDNNLDKDLIRLLVSGHSGKIRKLAAHPHDYIFCSISNDKTLRFWDSISRKVIIITKVKDEKGSCLCFNPKGDTLVVGNEFGEISIWNVKITRDKSSKTGTLLGIEVTLQARKYVSSKVASGIGADAANVVSNRKHRQKQEVSEVKYSPSGNVLVVACRDNLIHILSVESNFKRLAVCRGHTSHVRSMDFSVDGSILQSTDASRELLYWEVATGKLINAAPRVRDVDWHSWSCLYGWPVQGIFNGDAGYLTEGDINSVSRSHAQDLVVVGGSNRYSVKLFSYPALPGAIAKQYGGHASPVLDSLFTVNDTHVITSGGNDTSIFQWEVIPDTR
jgi:WD40 repeat protein